MARTTNNQLNNIEKIIKAIKEKTTKFNNIIKYDGITIEFTIINDIEKDKKEVESICKELKLKQYILENNKYDNTKFMLQFPQLTPIYTEEEIQLMYKYSFKWLLDDAIKNKPDITKSFILENTSKYVKLAITMYYRSNVNQYKEKLDDYLNDVEYRNRLNNLFKKYLEEYWHNRG